MVAKGTQTEIHDVVTANCTVLDNDVPGPKGYCVPLKHGGGQLEQRIRARRELGGHLFDLETRLSAGGSAGLGDGFGARGGVFHVYVGHGEWEGAGYWWRVVEVVLRVGGRRGADGVGWKHLEGLELGFGGGRLKQSRHVLST